MLQASCDLWNISPGRAASYRMTATDTDDMLARHGLLPPKTLTISLTGACNLACLHCWVDAGKAASPRQAPEPALRRLIWEFAAMGGTGVRITGGEPLCHPAWLELILLSRDLGLRAITLQTNAMLMTDRDVAALRELDFPGFTIQVSLDGASASSHDRVRGSGAFRGALEGLQRLAAGGLGPRIAIFFTEMRHNLAEIPALLELSDGMSISRVTTGTLVRCGRAGGTSTVKPPTPGQYLKLLDQYDRDPHFRERYDRIATVAAVEWRHASPRTDCCTFIENPYLTPDGRLYPCLFLHNDRFSVTGLFAKDLRTALAEGAPRWSTLRETSRRRSSSLPACRECPEQPACGGGCMGRAWGSCGDLLAPDDRCRARKKIGGRKNSGVP